MKWVKASERLPSKPGAYFARLDDGRKLISWFGRGQMSLFNTRRNKLEWLEE